MKNVVLLFIMAIGCHYVNAQQRIVNKANENIVIYGTGLDQVNNQIRYQKDSITTDSTYVLESGIIYCPDMWAGLDNNKVLISDLLKTGRQVSYNFSTALIWGYNLLMLNQNEWELK